MCIERSYFIKEVFKSSKESKGPTISFFCFTSRLIFKISRLVFTLNSGAREKTTLRSMTNLFSVAFTTELKLSPIRDASFFFYLFIKLYTRYRLHATKYIRCNSCVKRGLPVDRMRSMNLVVQGPVGRRCFYGPKYRSKICAD